VEAAIAYAPKNKSATAFKPKKIQNKIKGGAMAAWLK
jgi:hypothetical protein